MEESIIKRNINVAICSDYINIKNKEKIKIHLANLGCDYFDFGIFENMLNEDITIIHTVSNLINIGKYDFGIIISEDQIMSMVANKYRNVRAAVCWDENISEAVRNNNDANILCLPTKCLDDTQYLVIVTSFLFNEFEGDEKRVKNISLPIEYRWEDDKDLENWRINDQS